MKPTSVVAAGKTPSRLTDVQIAARIMPYASRWPAPDDGVGKNYSDRVWN
jgi:hypothetical protein